MFESIGRSWELTKISFKVLLDDKELLVFPIIAGILSFIFLIIMAIPILVTSIASEITKNIGFDLLFYVVLFVFYLGASFITTFFNVCAVYTIKKRFEGGNSNFFEAIGFALSRVHLIFAWSIVSATVGLILNMLSNIAQRMKGIGGIVLQLITSLLGGAWGIITIFVVPVMVYDNVGPFAAIKGSIETLKKTWGEQLVRIAGLGAAQGLILFGIFLLGIILFIILLMVFPLLAIIELIIMLILFVLIGLIFSVINTVFNTALFVYARTGKIPLGYPEDTIKNAFKTQQQKPF